MSIHDELIAKTLMAKPETDEDYLNIDWESRLITIPSTLTNIGVYNDKDTNRLYFRCPIEYGEFKIADFGIRVNYQNTGISTTKYDGDVYFVDDVESDGEYLTFSWLVGRHAYLEQGTTAFIVCCKVVDSDDNVVNELNTTIATLSVLEGLEVDVLPPEDYPDYLEEILRRCEDAENKVNEVADSAITGVTVNGTEQPVNDNIAELTISGGGVLYGTCSTSASTANKVVSCSDLTELVAGTTILVYFSNASTAYEPTLNVNSTGAKSIGDSDGAFYYFGWAAGTHIMFVYDGEYWLPIDVPENYVGASSTAASTQTKTATIPDFVSTDGAMVTITFQYANTASTPRLNISGTGAVTISGVTNWDAGDTITFVRYSSFYYAVRDPSAITAITVNGESVPVEDNTAEIEVAKRGTVSKGGTLTFTGDGVFVICANREDALGDVWYCTGGACIQITKAGITHCAYEEQYEITVDLDVTYFIIGATSIE